MDFAAFRLTDDERTQLLAVQTECTVGWLKSDGWLVSAFLTYLFERDAFWVTSFRNRPRVDCLIADPRSTVAVSSAGKPLAHGRMVSARTSAVVHDDVATAEWFYPQFCEMAGLDAAVLARQDRSSSSFVRKRGTALTACECSADSRLPGAINPGLSQSRQCR